MRLGLACIAAALALTGERASAQASRDAEVVSLHFGWKPGHVADVVERRERLSGGTSVGAAELRYRLAVRAEGDALVVDRSEEPGPPPPGALVVPEPSIRITREGAFAGVVDEGALRERTRAALTAQLGERASEGAALIASATQPELLRARAQGDWNLLIESWLGGRAFALGGVYQLSAKEERPDGALQLRYEIGASRRVPCSASETRLRCVELGMRWSPIAEHAERALRAQLAGAIPAEAKLTEPALRTEVLLVAEPGTMLPHSYRFRRTYSGTAENGAVRERFEIAERSERSYAWRLVSE